MTSNKTPRFQSFITMAAWHSTCIDPFRIRLERMLRIEMQDSGKALTIRLEGRFTADGAEHTRMLVARSKTKRRLVVDLTEVTFIDSVGEAALSFFSRLGAKFVAEDAYTFGVCERLHLTLARNQNWKDAARVSKASRTDNQG
jgi:hypothetical protein